MLLHSKSLFLVLLVEPPRFLFQLFTRVHFFLKPKLCLFFFGDDLFIDDTGLRAFFRDVARFFILWFLSCVENSLVLRPKLSLIVVFSPRWLLTFVFGSHRLSFDFHFCHHVGLFLSLELLFTNSSLFLFLKS